MLLFLLVALLQMISFISEFDMVKNQGKERAQLVKDYLQTQVDFSILDQYNEESEIDAAYLDLKQVIMNLKASSGAKFVYISKLNADGSWIYFVDAYTDESDLYTPLGTPIEEDYVGIYQQIEDQMEAIPGTFENGDFGPMVSSYFPVLDNQGTLIGLIGTDFDITKEYEGFIQGFLRNLALSLVFFLIAATALFLYVRHLIHQPIQQLIAATSKLSDGDLTVTLPVNQTHEMGLLASHFNTMSRKMHQVLMHIQDASSQVTHGSDQVLSVSM